MKKIIIAFIQVLITVSVSAQDITTVFLSTPSEILLGLDAEQKDKLVSNRTDSTQVVVENALAEDIIRLGISDDYIALQTSPIGRLEIKLLPLVNNSIIVCVIKTVCGKACDSQIQFYTTDWQPLPESNLVPTKDINWFFKDGIDRSTDEFKMVSTVLDMDPVQFRLSPNDLSLLAEYDIKKYLSADDYKKLAPFLTKSAKVFNWNKVSFK